MKRREAINRPLASRISASVEAAAMELMQDDPDAVEALSGGAGIEVLENGTLKIGKFYITSVGMYMDDTTSETEWEIFGHLLKRLRKSMQLIYLDHLAQGRRYGDLKEKAALFGYNYDTLKQYIYILSNVPVSMRIDNLSLYHYEAVAKYSADPEYQAKWLKAASEGDGKKPWGYRTLKQMMARYDDPSQIPQLPPTTPPRRRDPLERFNRIIEPIEVRLPQIIKSAGPQSRAEMAQKLRKMLEMIEGGGGQEP